jgi:hypothetical protein
MAGFHDKVTNFSAMKQQNENGAQSNKVRHRPHSSISKKGLNQSKDTTKLFKNKLELFF